MKTLSLAPILASLNQAHYDLAYAQAGFNIHDCSDSMHAVDEHEATIDALLGATQGQCSEADLEAFERSYVKGYATFANDHGVFSKKLAKKRNESDELTRVSSNTDVDFSEPEGWTLFCEVYTEVKKAEKAAKSK